MGCLVLFGQATRFEVDLRPENLGIKNEVTVKNLEVS